jgi:hypothetical protein
VNNIADYICQFFHFAVESSLVPLPETTGCKVIIHRERIINGIVEIFGVIEHQGKEKRHIVSVLVYKCEF